MVPLKINLFQLAYWHNKLKHPLIKFFRNSTSIYLDTKNEITCMLSKLTIEMILNTNKNMKNLSLDEKYIIHQYNFQFFFQFTKVKWSIGLYRNVFYCYFLFVNFECIFQFSSLNFKISPAWWYICFKKIGEYYILDLSHCISN